MRTALLLALLLATRLPAAAGRTIAVRFESQVKSSDLIVAGRITATHPGRPGWTDVELTDAFRGFPTTPTLRVRGTIGLPGGVVHVLFLRTVDRHLVFSTDARCMLRVAGATLSPVELEQVALRKSGGTLPFGPWPRSRAALVRQLRDVLPLEQLSMAEVGALILRQPRTPTPAERERWQRQIAQLQASTYTRRQRAQRQLAAAGLVAVPVLRAARAQATSFEARARLDRLLAPYAQLDAARALRVRPGHVARFETHPDATLRGLAKALRARKAK